MFLEKITKWFENKDDVTADIAKSNNRWYEYELKERRRKYIKTLCKEIKVSSAKGSKSITTLTMRNEIMTPKFMQEIKEYFEQRGFIVKEEGQYSGAITSWLRIRWD